MPDDIGSMGDCLPVVKTPAAWHLLSVLLAQHIIKTGVPVKFSTKEF